MEGLYQRQYIRDFDRLVETMTTAQELYDKMLEPYPNRALLFLSLRIELMQLCSELSTRWPEEMLHFNCLRCVFRYFKGMVGTDIPHQIVREKNLNTGK